MEINKEQPSNTHNQEEVWNQIQRTHNRGRLVGGILVIIVGLLFLGREMGLTIPGWLFTWQMLLIAIGLYTGIKHSFRNFSWFVLMLVGGAFLLRDFYPDFTLSKYVWPIAVILVGLALIFKPKSKFCKNAADFQAYKRYQSQSRSSKKYRTSDNGDDVPSEDYIDASAIFGGVMKNIISKDFKGGEISAVFGGVELNMAQADFKGQIELEINAVFGGVSIIIPPHWEVQSELTAVLGSVEDKRPLQKDHSTGDRNILILRGSAVFGGIEIKSYS
jgi:predicted membrane protein